MFFLDHLVLGSDSCSTETWAIIFFSCDCHTPPSHTHTHTHTHTITI